jgi:hypothetical protein
MTMNRCIKAGGATGLVVMALALWGLKAKAAESLSGEEFRRELVGVPLCGTPANGPFAGKSLCTVHLPDGSAVVAGAGMLVRGMWEEEAGRVCRRNEHEPAEKRHCVSYDRLGPQKYQNSDGVEFCIGPCP